MLRTRNAATAPSQPSEKVTCAVMVNLRTEGVIAGRTCLIPHLAPVARGCSSGYGTPAHVGNCFSAQQRRMTVEKVRGASQELGDSRELIGIETLQHGGYVFS